MFSRLGKYFLKRSKEIRKGYFTFLPNEVLFLFVVFLLSGAVLLSPEFFTQHKTLMERLDFSSAEKKKSDSSWYQGSSHRHYYTEKNNSGYSPFVKKETGEVILHNFDPNTADEQELSELGLKKFVVTNLLNYRSKGGQFRKADDLRKVYGLTEDDYNTLAPFIVIDSSTLQVQHYDSVFTKKIYTPKVVELNNADSLQLVFVRGIGPKLSSGILKYRKRLGGYVSVEQLKEVYGLRPEAFDTIKQFFVVDVSLVNKILINKFSADEMKHPYLKYSAANAIVQYRNMHGGFKNADDLSNVDALDAATLRKLLPYISFDE